MAGLGPPAPGDPARIGPYRLVGRLGQGGWGPVYGALDGAGRRVAVEVLGPGAADRPEVREAFARRAEVLRDADGVFTPEVVASDAAADPPWVATAHAPGPDLESYLRAHGPPGEDALLAFAAGTAEALYRVHAAGAVHGDLRPSRVVLTPSGPRPSGTGAHRPGADASSDVAAWGALVTAASGESVPASLEPMVRAAMDPRPPARPDAESIYRGLLDFAVDRDIHAVPTAELAGTLRDVVAALWGEVARTASGWPDGDWSGGGAPGEDPAPQEPAVPEPDAPPAAMGRVPSRKLAAVVAAAVIGTTGAGVGGLYAARTVAGEASAPGPAASPSPSPTLGPPEQVVGDIVTLFEETDSYRVVEAVDTGAPEAERRELVFRADPDVFMLLEGGGPVERVETLWLPETGAGDQRRFSTAVAGGGAARYTRVPLAGDPRMDGLSSEAAARPFGDLAASMEVEDRAEEELDGRPTTRFTGTFTVGTAEEGTAEEGAEHAFALWVDRDGRPVRLEHGEDPDSPAATLEYSGFGGELDRWACGTVSGVPQVDEAMLIATSEEVSCERARAAAEGYLDLPDERKQGTGYVAEVDGWTCGLASTASTAAIRASEEVGYCAPGAPDSEQSGQPGQAGQVQPGQAAQSERRVDFIRLD